jgi:hypothetical protein
VPSAVIWSIQGSTTGIRLQQSFSGQLRDKSSAIAVANGYQSQFDHITATLFALESIGLEASSQIE